MFTNYSRAHSVGRAATILTNAFAGIGGWIGFEVEIFLVNQEAEFYRNNVLFWNYIETHLEAREAYQRIKEEACGVSTRAYYTRKAEYISEIMRSIGITDYSIGSCASRRTDNLPIKNC